MLTPDYSHGPNNFNIPGNLPEYFQITGEIRTGGFTKTLYYDNIYDHEAPTYEMTFDYCFDFNYRHKIKGVAYVYRGGF